MADGSEFQQEEPEKERLQGLVKVCWVVGVGGGGGW